MKTLKDLTSYHKGDIPYQGILTLPNCSPEMIKEGDVLSQDQILLL